MAGTRIQVPAATLSGVSRLLGPRPDSYSRLNGWLEQPKPKPAQEREEVEARATLNSGASVSRTFVAAILIVVALGLAAMGGYLVRGVAGSGAAVTHSQTYAAPGTVLRQDNPGQQAPAPASQHTNHGYRELD